MAGILVVRILVSHNCWHFAARQTPALVTGAASGWWVAPQVLHYAAAQQQAMQSPVQQSATAQPSHSNLHARARCSHALCCRDRPGNSGNAAA